MAVKTKIQVRRDTAANWTSVNPILAAGNFNPTVTYTGSGLGGYGGNLMAGSWISIKKTPEIVGAWT